MGYTHYWEFKKSKIDLLNVKKAFDVLKDVVNSNNELLAWGNGTGEPEVTDSVICFNGIEDDSHESFYIDIFNIKDFDFCKTARKPYDKVVVICLMVLKYYLKDGISISSDGYKGDENFDDSITLFNKYVPDENIDPYSLWD